MNSKLIMISCMSILALSCKAQISPSGVIPVEDFRAYLNNDPDIPDGTYIKDVNNVLKPYVGTWIGTHNNRTYEFQIFEFTDSYLGITEDKLRIHYKIIDINGNIIESTLNLSNNPPPMIKGRYLAQNGTTYVLSYVGRESECGQKGDVFIEVMNDPTKMRIFLEPEIEWISASECPNGVVNQILPTDQITLTKQ